MKNLLNALPWLALMTLAVVSVPRSASTAPPPERHPHIRGAIRELREARRELQVADRDFCGHRADAVKETDEALRQLQLALDCDRR
jgi:hypothetical protein